MENPAQLFDKALQQDRRYLRRWMVDWKYQRIRSRQKKRYADGVISDFFDFKGVQEISGWMNWFTEDYPDYIGLERLGPLIAESRKLDTKVLERLGVKHDYTHYDLRVGINNAHDFLLPQSYPVPDRRKIKRVVDFGAGYGRQANLWTSQIPDVTYIGVDAIVSSYSLQHLYYKAISPGLTDYIENPSSFRIDFGKGGLFHLPTWRLDLIPDNSIDMVMCVQVLPELNDRLAEHILNQFHRILKPGGMFYVRDHAYTWKPSGAFDVEKHLQETGFTLEFRAHIVNNKDLHGVPRIWRKDDPEVIASQTMSAKQRRAQQIENLDTFTGGLLRKVYSRFKGKKA
jgi:SAM-dependent methyltransferase